MPEERIGQYDVEYAGEPLRWVPGWAAWVCVREAGGTLHRPALFPRKRVHVDVVYETEEAAESAAHEAALELLGKTP